jgi:hypothetical protein
MAKPLDGLKSIKLHEKVSKVSSGFMTEDQGPFECGRCDWYHTNHSCELVDGTINPKDCCNLFKSKDLT